MYTKRSKGYKKWVIQDVECWVPPEGWVWDNHHMGQRMVHTGVYSRSEDPAEQYWEPPPEPEHFDKKYRAQLKRQELEPGWEDPELVEYANQEWFRRLNGFWFMNNGKPTYITGLHYFYLAHWHIDIGLPSFFWADLLYFYFWASADEDPRCLGICNYANRRSGKTYRGGCVLFEVLSRSMNTMGGIQSKNDLDARKVFDKHMVQPMLKLKYFFMPEYDRESGRAPKKKLRFFPTNVRGRNNADAHDLPPALNTEIDYRPAGEKAYDGAKLRILLMDEFGKLDPEVSLIERHRVVKYCVQVQGEAVGKLIYATTVEDMSSGRNIEESKQLFDESDPRERLADGRTTSGLYRFRLPAYETYMYDKYGMPRTEESKKALASVTDELIKKGDFVGYASEKRKQPWTDADIFRVAAKTPVWDTIKLQDQYANLIMKKPEDIYTVGNFGWEGGVQDSRVVFVPMKNGRFKLVNGLGLENEVQNLKRPKNKHRFGGGCDPFEQKFAKKPSKGAAHVIAKPGISKTRFDNAPVLQYLSRPSPMTFFEDIIKMCIFMGCDILVESNKVGLINHMESRGYHRFLVYLPNQSNAGIYANDRSKELGSEAVADYVQAFYNLIPFDDLVTDMTMFDISNSTEHDLSMSFMWTVLNVRDQLFEEYNSKKETKQTDVENIVRSYKIRR